MWIALDGKLVRQEEAVVSVYDHGFLYGMGCFETFRTYGGKAFLLKEHLGRLTKGLQDLDIIWSMDQEFLQAQVSMLLKTNELEDGYFRLSVSAGKGEIGLPAEPYTEPVTLLYVKPLPQAADALYIQGKALAVLETRRFQPETAVRHKSFHYMSSILGKQELTRKPWAAGAEGLFLTPEGYLAEGMTSNLFFIQEGALHTPAIDTGILPGITRDYVMNVLQEECSVVVKEGFYTWEELIQAEEIFITNSIQELVPITRIFDVNGLVHEVGDGTAGYHTTCWLNLYRNKARGS